MVIINLTNSRPSGQKSVYIMMCSACIQTSESILCNSRASSPSGACWFVSFQEVLYFPDLCIVACAPFYLRLSENCTLAPKHVEVFKTYVQFEILLCALVGKGVWLFNVCFNEVTVTSKFDLILSGRQPMQSWHLHLLVMWLSLSFPVAKFQIVHWDCLQQQLSVSQCCTFLLYKL